MSPRSFWWMRGATRKMLRLCSELLSALFKRYRNNIRNAEHQNDILLDVVYVVNRIHSEEKFGRLLYAIGADFEDPGFLEIELY